MSEKTTTNFGNKEIFIRNLKRYLESSGKKQNEVANAIGVSTGTFCDWMKGRAYPRIDKIQLIADFFGIKKADLVEDVNVTKESVSNKEQEVLDLFHKVPEEKREFVLSLIRATIDNL
jgi:transcriptional regulator with XRE-family HTH domain